jgi:hypothetical protein
MKKASSVNTTPRWKRSPTKGTLVGVRLQDEEIRAIDGWAKKQEPAVTRPYAIRRLVELGLTVKSAPKQNTRARAGKANAMAGKQLDELVDASASADQQATRKRRLLRGPEEFQSVRIDRPAKKK